MAVMTAQNDQMLTIDQAARVLNVTARTLQRLAHRGEVPGAKVGGEWRFPPDIAERMIERTGARPDVATTPAVATVGA